MSDESEYDFGEGELEEYGEGSDCDYGFEFCCDPFLRDSGCCFECWLYQEETEAEEEERGERLGIEQQIRNPT